MHVFGNVSICTHALNSWILLSEIIFLCCLEYFICSCSDIALVVIFDLLLTDEN